MEAPGMSINSFSKSHIAIVVPAFRAENTLKVVISNLPKWVRTIIIINDASPDNTLQVAKECRELDSRVVIKCHKTNQGVGGAVITGYQEAIHLGAQIIVKMDSDGQMDPKYLPKLIMPIIDHQADYTKGNRFLYSRELLKMPLKRRIGNIGLSFLTKIASGYWNIFDPTNGYTAISADIIPLLDVPQIDKRYFFESSMLLNLGQLRAVVKDVSIPARYENEISSLSEWKTLFEFPLKLSRGFIKRILIQYFIRDFTAVSLFIITGAMSSLFGLIWGIVKWVHGSLINIPVTTGTVMIAVLPLILGVQLILQAIVLDVQNVPKDVLSDEFRK
jgi:glycosyltransferase involved in cell wall biosynthesis